MLVRHPSPVSLDALSALSTVAHERREAMQVRRDEHHREDVIRSGEAVHPPCADLAQPLAALLEYPLTPSMELRSERVGEPPCSLALHPLHLKVTFPDDSLALLEIDQAAWCWPSIEGVDGGVGDRQMWSYLYEGKE